MGRKPSKKYAEPVKRDIDFDFAIMDMLSLMKVRRSLGYIIEHHYKDYQHYYLRGTHLTLNQVAYTLQPDEQKRILTRHMKS